MIVNKNNMKKIRTTLRGSWGNTVLFGSQEIPFDKEGMAEVDEQTALALTTNFPETYYYDGQPEPHSETVHTPPEVDEDFRRNFDEGITASIEELIPKETVEQMEARIRAELKAEMAAEAVANVVSETVAENSLDQNQEGGDDSSELKETIVEEVIVEEKTPKVEVVEEVKAEEADSTEKNQALKEELEQLDITELKTLLTDAKVNAKEFKGFKEDQLIDLIIEKKII